MTTTSFLGIPVDGDIVRPDRRVKQRPLGEFTPLVQAVLDDQFVTEFGWRQYTPYFNDGDPCVFGAHGLWVRTVVDSGSRDGSDRDGEDEDADRDQLDLDYHPTLSPRRWNEKAARFEDVELAPQKAASYARCKALADAIDSGAFDEVLLEAFGDHADIAVKRDGITVEFYEHD